MKIVIDTDILEKNNLTIEEFFILWLSNNNINILSSINNLKEKNIISNDIFDKGKFIISDNIKNLLSSVLIESEVAEEKESWFLNLAKAIQKIYPKGKKSGTNYSWRGTTTEIAKRLKILKVKYKCSFNEDQVINATKNYIASFNGVYTKMRLLKYFILKIEKDSDNNAVFHSDLMEIIENEDEQPNQDWTTTLV